MALLHSFCSCGSPSLSMVNGKERRKFQRLNYPKNVFRKLRRTHSTKGEKPMRKTPYHKELLETMASLFSLSTPLFTSRIDTESCARQSYVFRTYLKGDDITIQYKDGVAVLIGTVSHESHKLLAKETLASLPGVILMQPLQRRGASWNKKYF